MCLAHSSLYYWFEDCDFSLHINICETTYTYLNYNTVNLIQPNDILTHIERNKCSRLWKSRNGKADFKNRFIYTISSFDSDLLCGDKGSCNSFPHVFHLLYGTLGDLAHGIVVKLSCKIIKLKNQWMFKICSKNAKYISANWY